MKTAIYLRQSLDRDENKLAIDRQRGGLPGPVQAQGLGPTPSNTSTTTPAPAPAAATTTTRCSTDIEAGAVGAGLSAPARPAAPPATRAGTLHRPGQPGIAWRWPPSPGTPTRAPRRAGWWRGSWVRSTAPGWREKSARQKLAHRQRAKAGKPWMQRTFGYDTNTIVPREAEGDPQGLPRAAQRRDPVEHRQRLE